ncbi:MAG: putative protoporphyrinogen oxidase, partial [Rhodoferax sp.]|nr:putative protoporphyrinogen oxidase [Rhodoferax sp.]
MNTHVVVPRGHAVLENPFRSFWMGGFEGADHRNGNGLALDMARAHGHVEHLDGDYARAAELGITSVRESIGWRLCETAPGVFDLSRPLRMAQAARRHGVQILWTVMHYGTPPGVSLLDDALIDRFALFAAEVARVLGNLSADAPVYTPVNEINFLSWAAAHTNLIGGYVGDPSHAGGSSRHSGYAIKRRLVMASLAAAHAMREVDPRARFMQVEPLVHVVAPPDRPDLAAAAAEVDSYQWQTWDLLAGRAEPGLGGSPAMLDLLGVNHYHNGQWEVGTERRLRWHERDPRRRAFEQLLGDAWRRYGRPLVVSETSHVGAGRGLWLSDIASQVAKARARGVPVWGLCLYPLVDRPDWNEPDRWHHSGLWDVARGAHGAHGVGVEGVTGGSGAPVGPGAAHGAPEPRHQPPAVQHPRETLARVLHRPYAEALARWRERLPESALATAAAGKPSIVVFSHQPWELLQRRPQHLMTMLARDYRVTFVEAPRHSLDDLCLVTTCPQPDIEVLTPFTPAVSSGFDGAQLPLLRRLLQHHAREQANRYPIAWLCTPAALPLATALDPAMLVYDCTQDVVGASQVGTPWHRQEQALLAAADLVLVAGQALHGLKRLQNPAAICLLHAVDASHFAPAGLPRHGSAADEAERLLGPIRGAGRPVLGYVGSIDERLDVGLLATLAAARPQWQFVMVGPTLLNDAGTLPRRPNLHWLGPQPYELLPHLLARCQVALLPFLCGPRTHFANPPQLLEYLAAHLPVVSTP